MLQPLLTLLCQFTPFTERNLAIQAYLGVIDYTMSDTMFHLDNTYTGFPFITFLMSSKNQINKQQRKKRNKTEQPKHLKNPNLTQTNQTTKESPAWKCDLLPVTRGQVS